jgi:hypothetical protein
MKSSLLAILALVAVCDNLSTDGFVMNPLAVRTSTSTRGTRQFLSQEDNKGPDDDYVAKRIIVKGDVQGGYYRSCVLNEVRTHGRIGRVCPAKNANTVLRIFSLSFQAGRFRRLVGTMSPPDDSEIAEIYVEVNRFPG